MWKFCAKMHHKVIPGTIKIKKNLSYRYRIVKRRPIWVSTKISFLTCDFFTFVLRKLSSRCTTMDMDLPQYWLNPFFVVINQYAQLTIKKCRKFEIEAYKIHTLVNVYLCTVTFFERSSCIKAVYRGHCIFYASHRMS